MYQGALDELNSPQTPRGKYKVKTILCRRRSHDIKDLEDICSRFDQVIPMVSHFKVSLPEKYPTPKNIGKSLGGPQRYFWKESLLFQYDKNKNCSLLSAPTPIKSLPEGTKVLCSFIVSSIKEGDCSDAWKFVARH